MKIQYNGTSAVDIPGHDEVQPGQVVEVDDAVGESLLLAGHGFADDGTVVAQPDAPLWSRPGRNVPVSSEPAAAEKES